MDYSILKKYIIPETIDLIINWTKNYNLDIIIKNSRKNKLGDYKKINSFNKNQITVNKDLSKELFTLVLTHEIAHLIVCNKYKNALPHGTEWKKTFSDLIIQSLNFYSKNLKIILLEFAKNPKASFYADSKLAEFFLKENPDYINLNSLKENSYFKIKNNIYQILEKKQIRYLCLNINNNKKYLIHELASIEPYNYDTI